MRFDLSQYETVQERLDIFHKQFPDGRVITQLLEASPTRYIVLTSLYRTSAIHEQPFATGLAEETVGSSPVNKTSAIENCETSSLGRALRNGGIGKNASREEMQKVERGNAIKPEPLKVVRTAYEVRELADACETIDQLRELYAETQTTILDTPMQYTDEDGNKVESNLKSYITHLSKLIGKES